MRILLAANASYVPPRGGATRSNLIWLDHLASSGHECRVTAAALPQSAEKERQLAEEGLAAPRRSQSGVEVSERGTIRIHAAETPALRSETLRQQVREFDPDWVMVSSEDVGQALLAEAVSAAPGRVVYLAHTPQFFPFGPASWSPNENGAALVRRAAGIVVIGEHMKGYVKRHLGRDAQVIHPPIYGGGPWPNQAKPDRGLVTIFNPCRVKGIDIFLATAARLPDVEFGAVPGWGTTRDDLDRIRERPNIRLLPNRHDIDELFAETRVLLMPSLWYEGFGLTAMEAMLRGIPVVASDSGGLEEAKRGTGYVIPVQAYSRYRPEFDERAMPWPEPVEQDAGPWANAVQRLLTDRAAYVEESQRSRRAAEMFVARLDAGAMERYLGSLSPRLSILLAHNSTYYPAHGGGDRSNRLLLEALAARGHWCRVVSRTSGASAADHRKLKQELVARDIDAEDAGEGLVRFSLHGVEVHTLTENPHLRQYFARQVEEFRPDVIIASTDDPAQLLLEAALKDGRARVVYLARTTLAAPSGPDCAFPSEQKLVALRRADAVVGVSEYVAGYMRRWGSMDAVHVPISLLEAGPWPELGGFDNEFVTLANPCAVKGISIFLKLAKSFPAVKFAAVPTWGTNRQDLEALAAHPNITILEPVDRIDDLLRRTRVLLVPSLWAEARSRIIVEAMLRGIPVLASDIGGIPEAKMGVPYLLPVKPIEKYHPQLDEQMVPVAEVPQQDTAPWEAALREILGDRGRYAEIARCSREAALRYARVLSVEPFEKLLLGTVRRERRRPELETAAPAGGSPLEKLSPEKRALLALMLKKRTAETWFPCAGPSAGSRLRLFAFPHAGGGTSWVREWNVGAGAEVRTARLPGRESRLQEKPLEEMTALVEALGEALQFWTNRPFAFFGHSMGAVVAFEVARWLRRRGQPLPQVLIASGARAPHFRLGWRPPPDPAGEQLLAELGRLGGTPPEVIEHPELRKVVLPALAADAKLYRRYVYEEEPPLDCPIRAWAGEEDPNILPEHLEAWRKQTTGSFAWRRFPGGHFYAGTSAEAVRIAFEEELGT